MKKFKRGSLFDRWRVEGELYNKLNINSPEYKAQQAISNEDWWKRILKEQADHDKD